VSVQIFGTDVKSFPRKAVPILHRAVKCRNNRLHSPLTSISPLSYYQNFPPCSWWLCLTRRKGSIYFFHLDDIFIAKEVAAFCTHSLLWSRKERSSGRGCTVNTCTAHGCIFHKKSKSNNSRNNDNDNNVYSDILQHRKFFRPALIPSIPM